MEEFLRTHPVFRKKPTYPSNLAVMDMVAYLTKHTGISDLAGELSTWETSDFPVASGGQGQVYRGKTPGGISFAIKCITRNDDDEKYGKRTARELSTWVKLKHPKILELTGLAMFRGQLAMISPWIEGGNVKAVLKDNPKMDPYEMCQQLAEVIEYLHGLNVVHGDIKGENLLMGSDGNLKLTDFGLTIMHDKTLQFTKTTSIGGTYRWMAPELLLEDVPRSKESDMYAVGMTMLEMITGAVPFREIKMDAAIINAVANARRTPDTSELEKKPVSPRAYIMIGAMHRCWRYDPKERMRAEELVRLLALAGSF